MTFYIFTRRAKNASFSNRTCKLGQLHGTFKDALKKASDLCIREEAEITVTEYDTGTIAIILRRYGANANMLVTTRNFEELVQ